MFRTMVTHLYPPVIFLIWVCLFYFSSRILFHFKKQDLHIIEETPGVRQIFTVLGALLSIFLGFILFIVWNGYEKANQIAIDETTKLHVLWESTSIFPQPVARDLDSKMTDYVSSILDHEWNAMAHGKSSPETQAASDELYDAFKKYSPEGSYFQTYYSVALNSLNEAVEQRNKRLNMLHVIIPVTWYLMMIFGALAICIITIFLLEQNPIAQFIHITICIFMAFYLNAILVLSYPYSGIISVSNEPYKQLLTSFSQSLINH